MLASIAFAFTAFDDDYTVERAIAGFRQMAILAGHFGLPEVLDNIVIALSQVSSLVPDTLITHVPFYPVVEVEGQEVTVSSLSVKFGTNFKGQLAAVVLFTIVNGNGNAIRDGWVQVLYIFHFVEKLALSSFRYLRSIKTYIFIRSFPALCSRWKDS